MDSEEAIRRAEMAMFRPEFTEIRTDPDDMRFAEGNSEIIIDINKDLEGIYERFWVDVVQKVVKDQVTFIVDLIAVTEGVDLDRDGERVLGLAAKVVDQTSPCIALQPVYNSDKYEDDIEIIEKDSIDVDFIQ